MLQDDDLSHETGHVEVHIILLLLVLLNLNDYVVLLVAVVISHSHLLLSRVHDCVLMELYDDLMLNRFISRHYILQNIHGIVCDLYHELLNHVLLIRHHLLPLDYVMQVSMDKV